MPPSARLLLRGRAAGTTARAIRHYEQAGLLRSRRADSGYRVYDEVALVRVRNIRYLLSAGLTLDDVRHFPPCLDGDVAAADPAPDKLAVAAPEAPPPDPALSAARRLWNRALAGACHVRAVIGRRSPCPARS
ncbi:DNA-binding transcriptional MerR regulator [Spinactinospora alkalitolerans]|uniref:DNA-binding transcriptional MerR regulator n=1 Tax=Spinactinospora alkalitolerans TaxID=687207 RepID=A0A852TW67_9ACTN|nr:MerR family transcriptional regulator [Spinactinospora alkalitolerans]NYE47635.1 DNA-binding transcriptional MerR regulator [Spinactinospora alkalitolerans]